MDGLWVNLAGVTLVGEYQLTPMELERLAVEGPFEATVATIHHPQLLPSPGDSMGSWTAPSAN